MYLRQPGFTYSACGPFTKKQRKQRKDTKMQREQEIQDTFIKTNQIKPTFNRTWLMDFDQKLININKRVTSNKTKN